MIFNFFKKIIIIDDLYDINFEFNGKFCEINIIYNNIHNLCTVEELMKSFILDKAIREI
jgi:hypothetical protein